MGWTKVGENKQQELCRLLDFVVKGVEMLKVAVLRDSEGSMMDGDDGAKLFWKEMWCPDILWSSSDTISNIEDAQRTLRRMRRMKKVMSSLSTSLDVAIHTVSDVVIQDSQETGIARLPDDILAQIFELYHLRTFLEGSCEPPESSEVLSLVCKRFYRIAIHLPLLWKIVTPWLSDYALSIHQTRCQLINVEVDSGEENLDKFLGLIHPHDQWEAPYLRYCNTHVGHRFYKRFNLPAQSRFNALKRLAIENGGDEGEIHDDELGEGEFPEESLPTILEADEGTLASWHCPNLTHLKMENVIPSIFFPCSNVTFFELRLDTERSEYSRWDLRVLRDFMQSMHNLESLEITLQGDMTFENVDVQQLVLPRLTSLRMELLSFARALHIGQFLDIVDTESLTKLCLVISLDGHKRCNDRGLDLFTLLSTPTLQREGANLWLDAVFCRPAPTCDLRRSFPNITIFDLNIQTQWTSDWNHPAFNPMFAALPNVQDLRLKLPDYFEIGLVDWVGKFGGLRALRTMRLDENVRWTPRRVYSGFFEALSEMDQWKNFEELEVVRSSSGSFYQENFEECVGNKLVWISPPV